MVFYKKCILTGICIAIVIALAYAPSLDNAFVAMDDDLLIYQNPVAYGLNIPHIKRAFTSYDPELYIPLTLLSYQLEYSLFKLDPFYYHLTNLLLHIGSALLVFGIVLVLARSLRSERESLWIAGLCALVFGLHPLNTSVVVWAAARKDALSSFLFLLSAFTYLLYLSRANKQQWYIASVVAFALALLSKISVVVLPLLLVLIDWFLRRPVTKKSVADKSPFFLLSIVFGIVALYGKHRQLTSMTPIEHILLSAKSTAFYLQKLFLPTGLNLFYPYEGPITFFSGDFILPFLLVILLVFLAVVAYRNRKMYVPFGIAFFLILLAPSFLNFWKNGYVYFADDRYAYIALVGIVFTMGMWFMPSLIRRERTAYVAAGMLTITLALLSVRQAAVWKDSETLYLNALKYNPRSTHAMNNLGSVYHMQGRHEEAMELYQQAIQIDYLSPQILANIGKLLYDLGQVRESLIWFERSVKAIPPQRMMLEETIIGYFFLGAIREEMGDIERAITSFEEAARAGPDFFSAQYNLGVMYHKYGRMEEAKAALERSLEIESWNLEAHYRLAAVLGELGDLAGAKNHLKYVVTREPGFERARYHLNKILQMQLQ